MKLKLIIKTICFSAAVITFTHFVSAEGVPVQGRVFLGTTPVSPDDLNSDLESEGLKELDAYSHYGVEILYPVTGLLEVGLRYTKHYNLLDEKPADSATEYQAIIEQDSVMAVLRVPFFKSKFIRGDVFAGFGGLNTTYSMKTAAQDGELSNKDSSGWFAGTTSSYGASVAIGYNMVYFVMEAGLENNKVEDFKKKGTINDIDSLDLSGGYFTVGILFDGVKATKK